MRYKATLVTGFGAGYLLGARAGRARYEQIMRQVRSFKDKPEVQETAGVMQAQAGDLLGSAKRLVEEKVVLRGGADPAGKAAGSTGAAGTQVPAAAASTAAPASMTGASSPTTPVTPSSSPTGTVSPPNGGSTVPTSGPAGTQVTDDLTASTPAP